MYVIRRVDKHGDFVAKPGSGYSYTRKLEQARIFQSREAADKECCGNEVVVAVDSILKEDR